VCARAEGVEQKEEQVQKELAQEVLRFHVLANSDSQEDQQIKLKVKDAVLTYMKEEMPGTKDLKKTKSWVEGHLTELEAVAKEKLLEESQDYPVRASVSKVCFPKKTYGDITFPAGEYEALRIEIGKAKGQNWWCCLYPNLCFIDAVHAVVPEEEKQELKNVLEEECYLMITKNTDIKIKWFFFGGNR